TSNTRSGGRAPTNTPQAAAADPAPFPPIEVFAEPQRQPPANKGHNKPRRLTRALGSRPRDVPGPPRFPSELTLDEAKVILGLEDEPYTAMRALFTQLCTEADIIKKTLAGPERWDAVKDELIRRFPPLEAEMWQSRDNHDGKKLALEVICIDCTKRMRVKNTRLSLPEARVILGINPAETRELRASFYRLVEARGLQSKTQAGVRQWTELKNEWATCTPVIQRVLAAGTADASHGDKLKALEILARDVMKRRWDDALRMKKMAAAAGGGQEEEEEGSDGDVVQDAGLSTGAGATTQARFQISPELYDSNPRGGNDLGQTSMYTGGGGYQQQQQTTAYPRQQLDGLMGTTAPHVAAPSSFVNDPAVSTAPPPPSGPQQSTSTAVFLRLHPTSTFSTSTALWIATLSGRSIRELRQAAVARHPGAAVLRVEGILKDGKGGEMPLLIDGDSELDAYMAHLSGTSPTFSVQLVPDWRMA
ncbi:hypothetical protein F5X68DRAFT_210126, partial [Plectosphaerella plurivora]